MSTSDYEFWAKAPFVFNGKRYAHPEWVIRVSDGEVCYRGKKKNGGYVMIPVDPLTGEEK